MAWVSINYSWVSINYSSPSLFADRCFIILAGTHDRVWVQAHLGQCASKWRENKKRQNRTTRTRTTTRPPSKYTICTHTTYCTFAFLTGILHSRLRYTYQYPNITQFQVPYMNTSMRYEWVEIWNLFSKNRDSSALIGKRSSSASYSHVLRPAVVPFVTSVFVVAVAATAAATTSGVAWPWPVATTATAAATTTTWTAVSSLSTIFLKFCGSV